MSELCVRYTGAGTSVKPSIWATHMVSALPSSESSSSLSESVDLQSAGVREKGEEEEWLLSLGSVMVAHLLTSPSA